MIRCTLAFVLFLAAPAFAQADDGHGPNSTEGFSHRFTSSARAPEGTQLAFHYGLLQPILLGGFNAAMDVRRGRFVATISHGQGLTLPSSSLDRSQRDANVEARLDWSTGFGLGAVLVDELYALVDFKVHDVSVVHDEGTFDYRTVTLGLELGYRLFLWRGLNVTLALRYWPNVYTGIDRDGVRLGTSDVVHEPIEQGGRGFFANVMLGWAFDVR